MTFHEILVRKKCWNLESVQSDQNLRYMLEIQPGDEILSIAVSDQKVSEYDQEIPQSRTADEPTVT